MSSDLVLVAGARPNFMKVAPVLRALAGRDRVFAPTLVPTGQHYDQGAAAKLGIPVAHVGHPIAREHNASRAGDVRHSRADTSRLREMFPSIQAVPFADGLRATVAWMRAVAPTAAR